MGLQTIRLDYGRQVRFMVRKASDGRIGFLKWLSVERPKTLRVLIVVMVLTAIAITLLCMKFDVLKIILAAFAIAFAIYGACAYVFIALNDALYDWKRHR